MGGTVSVLKDNSNSGHNYDIYYEGNCLLLISKSFKSEKTSVLHVGIFNAEMSAAFVSGGVALLYVFIVYRVSVLTISHYVIALVLAITSFPLSRILLFKEPALELLIDKDVGLIKLTKNGTFRTNVFERPLSDIKDVIVKHTEFKMSNPDGVEFVKKIALGHGTVIPGFGLSEHIYTVECIFKNTSDLAENIIIYSSKTKEESQELADNVLHYIKT